MKLVAIRIKSNGQISRSEADIEKETRKSIIVDRPLPEADYRKKIDKSNLNRIVGNRVVCKDSDEKTVREELYFNFLADLNDRMENLKLNNL